MSKRQLRWGLLGCGLITGDFAEALKLLPTDDHKIVALGSRSQERCEQFRTKHGLNDAKAYGSYDEFFKDPNIEIVYIGTRNNQHCEDVLRATKAKKHVLCEKPLGMNKGEVMKMIQAAKENGVYLQEGFWSRYFPVYHEVQKILKDGSIGDVQLIQANLGGTIIDKLERLNKADLGGGMALDLAGYLCQLTVLVFGEKTPIEKICCGGWNFGDVDDTACITIKYAGKRMVQLMYSGTTALPNSAHISGTKGRIEFSTQFYCPERCKVTILPTDTSREPVVNDIERPRPKADNSKFYFNGSAGLAFEAEGVRRHVLNGDLESSEIPLSETIKIAEMMDEIRKQMGMTE